MAQLDRIEDFRIIDAIARTGTLSAAARELNVSLTVVSKRLSLVEATLGLRLVQRTSRKLHFTEEGHNFLDHCRRVLEAVEAAQDVGADATQSGAIRVAAAVAFTQRIIAPRLRQFSQAHPGITVQVLANNRPVDLVEQQVDVAFRQAPLDNSAYITRTIAPDAELLCASPEYLAAHGTPREPADLRDHQCLTVGDPAPQSFVLYRGRESVEAPIRSAFGSTDGELPHIAALAGCGIALKSSWEVVSDFRAGRLVRVLPEWWGRPRSVRAVFPVRRHQPVRVRHFVDFMERELKLEADRHSDLGIFETHRN